jgi:hypothetical protein
MKKMIAAIYLMLTSVILCAQSNDDVNLVQSLWGMEKRAIVEEYMDLSPAEETAFWSEYEAYEASRKELGKERIAIISEYVGSFDDLNNEKATDLMSKAIANNIAIQKLAKKTFKKMSKSVSPVKAAQFIQLENYFITSIQMYLQETLPFIGELEELIEE